MKTFLMTLLSGLCLGLPAQNFRDIVIEPDTAGKHISYGSVVEFKFYTINKKNKQKDVNYRKVNDYIVCAVTGAEWNAQNGTIVFPARTADKGLVSAKITFTSNDGDVYLNQVMEIKMNFKQALSLLYKGAKGANGASGDNKGTPLLIRDGKLGGDGGNGGNGTKGGSITVRCKKEYDEFFKRDILFLYVTDDSLHTESVFRCPKPEAGIKIDVSGGNGGEGGKGGDGGNGKDGVKEGNEDKRPGDAGNGGKGGNGGNGGNGGKVTVIAHTNSSDVLQYLNIDNAGGQSGWPGKAGDAGKPGKAASGQTEAKTGTPGSTGYPGMAGSVGKPFELKVEEF